MPKLFDWIYPIGSVIANANAAFDPNVIYKHQTWVRWAKGQTLVGVNEDDTDFSIVDKTGGEKTHKLTASEMPSHAHDVQIQREQRETAAGTSWMRPSSSGTWITSPQYRTVATGGDAAHNNMPPYVTVYYWRRTA